MWLQMVAPVASGVVKGMFTAGIKRRCVFTHLPVRGCKGYVVLGAVQGWIPFIPLFFQTLLSSAPLEYSGEWPTACLAAREMWNSGARARFCWELGSSPEQFSPFAFVGN